MKFGKVTNLEGIDLSLPSDYDGNKDFLKHFQFEGLPSVYVGCSGWTKAKLKNFFPRGTKDELVYYSSQFNAIEMNASFYRTFSPEQFAKWKAKTTDDFKFFPKVFQGISHWKRLKDSNEYVVEYADGVSQLEEKLGMCFLQMHNNFAPTEDNIQRLHDFCASWISHIPLAIEVRHPDWYLAENIETLSQILETYHLTKVITDTAGRRDIIDMRLTSNTVFIRFVGMSHSTDHSRIDDWIKRLKAWNEDGLEHIYFFIHQHEDESTVELARYFIQNLNEQIGTSVKMPNIIDQKPLTLF